MHLVTRGPPFDSGHPRVFVNLYPVPYFYDTEGFMYTYDPVADRYTSDPDPATGIYYVYDLVNDRFYTYDPASGTYL